jgi:hypothetical protein
MSLTPRQKSATSKNNAPLIRLKDNPLVIPDSSTEVAGFLY